MKNSKILILILGLSIIFIHSLHATTYCLASPDILKDNPYQDNEQLTADNQDPDFVPPTGKTGNPVGVTDAPIEGNEFLSFIGLALLYIFTSLYFKKKSIIKSKFFYLFIFLLSGIGNLQAQPPVEPVTDKLYVKTVQSGTGDGSSWDNAFDGQYLAWFLRNKAVNGTKIYVAEGTYYPYLPGFDIDNDPRQYTFEINHDIEITGGYKANAAGTDLSSYNPKNNITRLSGEIQNINSLTDNSYQVVVIFKNKSVSLDGFYISDGYANVNGTTYDANGGGILDLGGANSIVTLSHLVVENNAANYGGGVYFYSNKASYLRNVIIQYNRALISYGGAGIFAWGDFLLENSTVNNNHNSSGILSWGGDMLIRNSTISGNETDGIKLDNSAFGDTIKILLVNTTIANNSATGVRIKNFEINKIRVSSDNSLIANNKDADFDFTGDYPVDTIVLSYTIAGNTKYVTGKNDKMTLTVPVDLDVLTNNGGWGYTHKLLYPCKNPAVNNGDPAILNNPLTQNDQRGIGRNNPPCIGSYDGIVSIPLTTKWTAKGEANNWNDPDNWDNGIPGPCTTVLIPSSFDSGVTPRYPILEAASESYPQATCDTIIFAQKGEVARTDYLTYTSAKIQLDILSNRWYLLSAPLRDMYSGDYSISRSQKRQHPAIYLMKYQAENPETHEVPAAQGGDFTNPFNTLTENLYAGLGFAVWVDNDEPINVQSVQSFAFPKDSMSYVMWDWDGNYIQTHNIPTGGRNHSGRFIYEERNFSDGTFSVDVKEDKSDYATALIGNPFMSHLDFNKFALLNGITGGYYIWTENGTFDALNPNNFTDDPNAIPPMQSFIVNKSGQLTTLNFNMDMSITDPGVSLRTSNGNSDNLRLDILRNGAIQSHIKLHYDESVTNTFNTKKDAWTLFSDEVTQPAVLYALIENKAASIYTFGDLHKPIELGIRTTEKGPLSLRLNNPENFDPSFTLSLEDHQTGNVQNLRTNPVYTFNNQTGNVKNRFFLKVSRISTEIENHSLNPLITTNNNLVQITSDINDPIHTIEVTDIQGRIVYKQTKLNSNSHAFGINNPHQVLIIRIQTEKNQKTEKLVLGE